jgi:hypothetical protein
MNLQGLVLGPARRLDSTEQVYRQLFDAGRDC